jgi:hypothetical protein
MLKKIIVLGIALAMLFAFAGAGCDDVVKQKELEQYKITAKAEIQAHANSKAQSEYSGDNWTAILQAVAYGKTEIEKAADKPAVDLAVAEAIQEMDNILTIVGEFAKHKADAIAEIEAYALERKHHIDEWTWENIFEELIMSWAIEQIDAAISESQVDNIVEQAKDYVNSLLPPYIRWLEQWQGKLEISLSFPETVKQGESFEITVKTENISDKNIVFSSYCGCCSHMGERIIVALQEDEPNKIPEFMLFWHGFYAIHNNEQGGVTIPVGQSIEHVWKFDGTLLSGRLDGTEGSIAPKGFYDIRLENGLTLFGAIEIV